MIGGPSEARSSQVKPAMPLTHRLAPRPAARIGFGFWLVALLTSFAPAAGGLAVADPADRCDQAAVSASRATGVPLPVLQAIALTESGRKQGARFRPWPWTVNMAGQGFWFEDQATALAYARSHASQGTTSFDVGCFQINYRWHGDAFTSIENMFDPRTNALYAAQFLRSLHEELGSWSLAAGAYHSRSPEQAKGYRARFETILAGLAPQGVPAPAVPEGPVALPMAAYPLLQEGGTVALGSLVALGPPSGRALIELADPKG